METAISVIGAVASFIGTAISWFQARKSSHVKKQIERYRDEIIESRMTSDLSILLTSLRHALGAMRKYGPASSVQSLDGINPHRDAEEVQAFLELLSEHRSYFEGSSSRAYRLIETAGDLVEMFVSAFPDVTGVKLSGRILYDKLNELLPEITKKLEKIMERTVA